ncbi:phosphate acyltransferase [Acetobacteroides hydrogenigenes]|uniref:Phosphate butyryltransferase n=1 Tax=Acetobacteroides hydrogenigenes TaxID=979970 RepID=A0A4V2RNP9_9BACT|nr:phosphate acyltransferase [Acetobacteroides hydrogenigenes]TCN64560.1 phosphate butyryltransferase [Acetobacteroides hydrogenigenes]
MTPIKSLDELISTLKSTGKKSRVAVVLAEDENTLGAVNEATDLGLIEAFMIGDEHKIVEKLRQEGVDPSKFTIINIPNDAAAAKEAVRMARANEVDMVMKGLIGTDKFLKAVLDKENGLLLPGAVMTYVCALQIPAYNKLLFISDPAVIPFPTLQQKVAMIGYAVKMANRFGIDNPKVALISAVEKPNESIPNTLVDATICKMANRGQLPECTIDGPLDVFLACDPKSVEIKGVPTPVNGDADILIFPSIEACNSFYKGLMLFADGELGGFIQGTSKPVIMMSRSESAKSKLYCIATASLMAN